MMNLSELWNHFRLLSDMGTLSEQDKEFLQKFLEPGSSGSYDSIAPGTMDIFSKDDNNDNNNLDSDEDEEEKEDMKIKPMFY